MSPSSASPLPVAAPVAILGIPFDPVTSDQTVAVIAGMIASRRSHYVVTPNVDFVVQALDDIELRKIIFDAHLVLCDGMPLVWASRFLGNPLPERVTGSDLVPRLLAEAEKHGWRVYFLGGRRDALDAAAAASLEKHPGLHLVGTYSPPLRPLLELDNAQILQGIRDARPDLLFVAFGCPKQEKWINMHYRQLGVPVSMGIGATFAFLGGTLRRAPVWMQRTGTEWLFRLLQEPGRLGRRYGKGIWVFSRAIARQGWLLRSRRRHARLDPHPPPAPAAPAIQAPQDSPPSTPPPHTVLNAPERLDAVAAASLTSSWMDAVDASHVAVDLHATRFIDSTGVGLLIRLRKRADQRQTRLLLCRCSAPVDQTLRLMRIEDFFARSLALPNPEDFAPAEPTGSVVANSVANQSVSVAWHGEITAVTREEMAAQAESLIGSLPAGTHGEIDLSRVTFADSSGLGFMLGLKKRSRLQTVSVQYRNPNPVVRNVMRLTSLEAYLLEDPRP